MFKQHHIYTHKNMIDCNIYVLKSYMIPDGRYKLKIRWFLKNGMDLNLQETVVVKREQVKNWREVL